MCLKSVDVDVDRCMETAMGFRWFAIKIYILWMFCLRWVAERGSNLLLWLCTCLLLQFGSPLLSTLFSQWLSDGSLEGKGRAPRRGNRDLGWRK